MSNEEFIELSNKYAPINISTGGAPDSGIVITFKDGTHVDVSVGSNGFLSFTQFKP